MTDVGGVETTLLLVLLGCAAAARLALGGSSSGSSGSAAGGVRSAYLVVYALATLGDWLQGPYAYRLYESYGHSAGVIGALAVTGYTSAFFFGNVTGPVADAYGRRRMALAYCLVYALSGATKMTASLPVLFLGRVLSGIATSLLSSVFESWMTSEHAADGGARDALNTTFARAHLLSGLMAITSGLLADASTQTPLGLRGPFVLSASALALAGVAVMALWRRENYGSRGLPPVSLWRGAMQTTISDPQVAILGIVQALTEGAMYGMVYVWAPMLEAAAGDEPVPLGRVFACLMVSVMLGSTLFEMYTRSSSLRRCDMETLHAFSLASAGLALLAAAYSSSYKQLLFSFCIFEGALGMYFPCQASMRAQHLPPSMRTVINSIFRMPLNVFAVVSILTTPTRGFQATLESCGCALLVAMVLWSLFAVYGSKKKLA